jgi:salicylate hydroxylase
VLATLLGHHRTTANNISRALQIYDSVRQPYANKVAERSRLNGHYFTFHGADYDGLPEETLRDKLRWLAGSLMKNWEWCWTTTLDGTLKDAVRMLESS